MQIYKKHKVILLILPLLFLSACSSKKTEEKNDYLWSELEDEFKSESIPMQSSPEIDNSHENKETEAVAELQMDEKHVIYFDFNRSVLNQNAENMLKNHISEMKSLQSGNFVIVVEGHTDERGTSEYNIALGERRALAVQNFLRTQGLSIPIRIVSYGKEKPVVLGNNTEAYAKNRRAVIMYKKI